MPLYDYTTINLPILLLMDIWVVYNLGSTLSNAAVNIIIHVISDVSTPRSAIALSQAMCVCLALVGTVE